MREPQLEYVAEAGLPAMMLLSRQTIPGVGYVDADNVGGIKKVVAHLAALGHRRIAYAGATDSQDFLDRLEGYRQGLEEAGIAWDPALTAVGEEMSQNWYRTNDTQDYEAALDRWLALTQPPTAIVLTTDGWAEWMIGALQRRGLRVPDDMAVTGFDNLTPIRHPEIELTSVAQDFREIGRLGAIGLAELIDGVPVEKCRHILPSELVVRASTVGGSAAPEM
jgi:DNA-binding LacI/PurR family transcriptional regulator